MSTEAKPLNAPSPNMPERPLICTRLPFSRTSALPVTEAGSRAGASMVNSVGMLCRSSGALGAVALMSNFNGCSPLRALPVMRTLRSAVMMASALRPSILLSTRSRRLENTIVPPLTTTCSIEIADVAGMPLDFAGTSRARSRCSGRVTIGRTMTSSVISGAPDQMLASVISASMLAAVRRLVMSRSFGSASVTSFIVTFSAGQRPTLVEPLMVSL